MPTRKSIAISALIFAAITLVVFAIVAIWFRFSLEAWGFLLPIVAVFGAGMGALLKWQGPDGLDLSDYIEHIERDLRVTVSDENASQVRTLGDLCRVVSQQRHANGDPLSDEEIWNAVRSITSDELGVRADELHPNLRYIEDLGC